MAADCESGRSGRGLGFDVTRSPHGVSGKRKHLILLAVIQAGHDLKAGQGVRSGKINGALFMAKVACVEWFGSPASEAPKV